MFALLWAIVHSNPVDTVYSELELGHQLLYVMQTEEVNITIHQWYLEKKLYVSLEGKRMETKQICSLASLWSDTK